MVENPSNINEPWKYTQWESSFCMQRYRHVEAKSHSQQFCQNRLKVNILKKIGPKYWIKELIAINPLFIHTWRDTGYIEVIRNSGATTAQSVTAWRLVYPIITIFIRHTLVLKNLDRCTLPSKNHSVEIFDRNIILHFPLILFFRHPLRVPPVCVINGNPFTILLDVLW
jgi:hypothetical protein